MNWIIERLIVARAKKLKENPTVNKIIEFLNGKKTYATAVAIGVVAALQYMGIQVPEYIYGILGALGLGFLRAGVEKK